MASTENRPGRKPRPATQGQRVSLGLKVTPEIKNKLDMAARENGRTQSQEAEVRIEQTFRGANYLDQALDLAYGPRLAVMICIIAKGLSELRRFEAFPNNWMDNPRLFTVAISEIDEILKAFYPGDEPEIRRERDLGKAIAKSLLWAVKHPETGASALRDWASPLHDKLGEHAGGLRVEERGVLTSIRGEQVYLEGWEP